MRTFCGFQEKIFYVKTIKVFNYHGNWTFVKVRRRLFPYFTLYIKTSAIACMMKNPQLFSVKIMLLSNKLGQFDEKRSNIWVSLSHTVRKNEKFTLTEKIIMSIHLFSNFVSKKTLISRNFCHKIEEIVTNLVK